MLSFPIAAGEVKENMLLLEDDWSCRDVDEFSGRNPPPSKLVGVVSLHRDMDASLGEMRLGSAVFDEGNASMKLPILSCEVFDEMPRRVEGVMLEPEEILLLVVEEGNGRRRYGGDGRILSAKWAAPPDLKAEGEAKVLENGKDDVKGGDGIPVNS
nr:hypothetical protein Iba_chr05dCG0790 [Ipomoea batatas]